METPDIKRYVKAKVKIDKKMYIKLKAGNIKNYYHFDRRVGEGTFGVVYEARNRVTMTRVAIKAIVNIEYDQHK
jgi:serine/threonine protein kinase